MTHKKKNSLETKQGALLQIVHPLLSYIKQTHSLDIEMQSYTLKPDIILPKSV